MSKKVKNLFIDANIWLSLFHYTNDDLEQFMKLKELLGTEIKVFVPEQIYNEVYRNRENKIKDALNKFEKFDLSFPVFIKNYEEYSDFHKLYSELKDKHKEWMKKIKKDIIAQSSPADIALQDFFGSVDLIPTSHEIIQRAVLRFDIGNPPGKDRKYGDAINWETLLENVPEGEDLFFVSADKDYASIYDDKCFHPFLAQEWGKKKKSNLFFFKSLADFLKKHVKDIELRAETEKDELIEELSTSGSFKTTHRIIEELSNYSDWTEAQIRDMCLAAINNDQILWILEDDDVFAFYDDIINDRSARGSNVDAIKTVSNDIQRIKGKRQSEDSDEWMT